MRRKELGGYIELETFQGREYYENTLSLNSGRACVEYLIRAKDIQKIYLPYYLCSSVRNLCKKLQVRVEYYHTDESFLPVFSQHLGEREYLYIVNYYGQVSDEKILDLQKQYGNVIIDNAQDFFKKPLDGLDTVYSCRKFFGVPDGAYLFTDSKVDIPIEQDYSYDRMHFLLGRYEKDANLFYDEYVANNERFAAEPMKRMSRLTHNLLRGIDYEQIKKRRSENFTYLHQKFKDINQLELTIPQGAYMYPLYIKEGEKIRQLLQHEKIYVPTLWPGVFDICHEYDLEYDMAMNILPLPVDQRYDLDDMNYLVDAVEECILAIKTDDKGQGTNE